MQGGGAVRGVLRRDRRPGHLARRGRRRRQVCWPYISIANKAHVPQKLTGSISLYTNPVSILRVPIQTVR
jgi:hypothetical protein